ncbi:hypothetical protein HYQ46_010938 [Verticillium longisporum]|nr:hypothetical protein HYQ46_010938 [Verticillium longisporum]
MESSSAAPHEPSSSFDASSSSSSGRYFEAPGALLDRICTRIRGADLGAFVARGSLARGRRLDRVLEIELPSSRSMILGVKERREGRCCYPRTNVLDQVLRQFMANDLPSCLHRIEILGPLALLLLQVVLFLLASSVVILPVPHFLFSLAIGAWSSSTWGVSHSFGLVVHERGQT